MTTSTASYKQQKEDFVSNLSGGSVTEICSVTVIAPIAILLWSVLQSRQSFFKPYTPIGYLVDFLINCGAILLAFTLYANQPLLLIGLLVAPTSVIYFLPPTASRRKVAKPPSTAEAKAAAEPLDTLSVKPFLTTYRGCMLVATAVAILAVDFRIFPRRFAKVETWGTSLMDLGVGSFVFSAGIVAARPVLRERAGRRAIPLYMRVLHSLRHSLPLLALGFIRLMSVKGLDYAEHVTEYGVHWNFFFTLGLLPPFVAVFESLLKYIPSYAALALILGIGYQVALETTSLKAFILIAPRTDLFSMNREGIFSFIGYLAIFLTGQDTGMYVLPRSLTRSGSSGTAQRNTLLLTMTVWSAVWIGLYLLSTQYTFGFGLDVSRRLANLPYILFVAAFNSVQILAFCLVDTLFFSAFYNAQDSKSEKEAYNFATSIVLRAYNRNGLGAFLLANLLTGLVNLSVPTLDVGPATAMGILIGYLAIVTSAVVVLDVYNVSIKL